MNDIDLSVPLDEAVPARLRTPPTDAVRNPGERDRIAARIAYSQLPLWERLTTARPAGWKRRL